MHHAAVPASRHDKPVAQSALEAQRVDGPPAQSTPASVVLQRRQGSRLVTNPREQLTRDWAASQADHASLAQSGEGVGSRAHTAPASTETQVDAAQSFREMRTGTI